MKLVPSLVNREGDALVAPPLPSIVIATLLLNAPIAPVFPLTVAYDVGPTPV